jgi:hypothetical protein
MRASRNQSGIPQRRYHARAVTGNSLLLSSQGSHSDWHLKTPRMFSRGCRSASVTIAAAIVTAGRRRPNRAEGQSTGNETGTRSSAPPCRSFVRCRCLSGRVGRGRPMGRVRDGWRFSWKISVDTTDRGACPGRAHCRDVGRRAVAGWARAPRMVSGDAPARVACGRVRGCQRRAQPDDAERG